MRTFAICDVFSTRYLVIGLAGLLSAGSLLSADKHSAPAPAPKPAASAPRPSGGGGSHPASSASHGPSTASHGPTTASHGPTTSTAGHTTTTSTAGHSTTAAGGAGHTTTLPAALMRRPPAGRVRRLAAPPRPIRVARRRAVAPARRPPQRVERPRVAVTPLL